MKTSLAHLPDSKRRRIEALAELLQREASVIMVILFGSYARGDWVEDPIGGYFSDFDILAIVSQSSEASDSALWSRVGVEATKIAGRTTVSLIVHDLKEFNREIRLGQYFFIDILHEGILLYAAKGYDLATPKALGPAARLELGQINFRYWFGSATEFWHSSGYFARRSQLAHAAFVLHQAAERYYHATLLVFTGYKPKTHNLEELAQETEVLHPALADAIPRAEGRDKELFELLRRAYIEARYSKSYRITLEELGILRERVREMAIRVRFACEERLASFCGTGVVGALPDPPTGLASEELLEVSSFDDAAAFEAWREALEARTFEQGREAGIVEGREAGVVEGREAGIAEGREAGIVEGREAGIAEGREAGVVEGIAAGREAGIVEGIAVGREAGIVEGLREALTAVLAHRGILVDSRIRESIERCPDVDLLRQWLANAMQATSASDVFPQDES